MRDILARPAKGWAWCFLLVFVIGFFVKGALIAREVRGSGELSAYSERYLSWLREFEIFDGLFLSSVAFLLFMLSVFLIPLSWCDSAFETIARGRLTRTIKLPRVNLLLLAVVVVFALTTILPPLFGFGQMGLHHNKLPFRLDALITRTRIVLIPFIMVLLIWLLDRPKYRGHWIVAVLLYLIFSLADALMRGSRSSVALAAIPMLVLWVQTGRLTSARKAIVGFCAILVVMSYPIFTALRLARVRRTELLTGDLLGAISEVMSIEGLIRYIDALIGRFQGINGLILSRDYSNRCPGSWSLDRLFDQSRMAFFHTHRVAGVPDEMIEGCAPGFLGGLINAGGVWFMYGAIIVIPLFVHLGWRKLRSLHIGPAAVAFGSLTLFLYINEGTFGLQTPIAFIVAIFLGSAVFDWISCDITVCVDPATTQVAKDSPAMSVSPAQGGQGPANEFGLVRGLEITDVRLAIQNYSKALKD